METFVEIKKRKICWDSSPWIAFLTVLPLTSAMTFNCWAFENQTKKAFPLSFPPRNIFIQRGSKFAFESNQQRNSPNALWRLFSEENLRSPGNLLTLHENDMKLWISLRRSGYFKMYFKTCANLLARSGNNRRSPEDENERPKLNVITLHIFHIFRFKQHSEKSSHRHDFYDAVKGAIQDRRKKERKKVWKMVFRPEIFPQKNLLPAPNILLRYAGSEAEVSNVSALTSSFV